jgi:uncharacterized protein DUF5615
VAGTFPLLTDEHISKALIKALQDRGWDAVRAVDVFGQRTDDQVLFEYAAEKGRVLVTTDAGLEAIAIRWLREWRAFPGLVIWTQQHQRVMSEGARLPHVVGSGVGRRCRPGPPPRAR